jgi:hypothetical protein
MKIYKFHTVNTNLLHSLRKKEHWCSRIDLLNDPYELHFIDRTENEVYKNFTKGICVCCFSKNMNEILMWSHYADNHKGVCLEFEIDEEKFKETLMEMKYDNNLTILDKVELHDNGSLKLNTETNGKFIITKFKNWEYEQELRITIVPKDLEKPGTVAKFLGDLTAIYFGKRTSKDDMDLVKFNSTHFEKLKFFQVDLDTDVMKISKIVEV